MQQDNESMKEQMRLLEDQMELEKRRREDAESENNKQKQVGLSVHFTIIYFNNRYFIAMQL